MKIFKAVNICVLAASLLFVTFSSASAKTKAELVQGMKDRISVVNELKAKGTVGETSSGYLAFVGSADNADVVNAENQDRKELYGIIAQEQGTTVQVIEKNMGVVKAQRAAAGEFLQDADGKWNKK